jgi:hypothetical protein
MWPEMVKRDFREWNVSKDLDLDKTAQKSTIHAPEFWFTCSYFYLLVLVLLCFRWVSYLAYPTCMLEKKL